MGVSPSAADALAIWRAAVAAVDPAGLVAARLAVAAGTLVADGVPLPPPACCGAAGRIAVVGGGKAAAGMAVGTARLLEAAGGRVAGIVSVPAGAAARAAAIELRATRPAGANRPTPAAEAATREMLHRLGTLGSGDLAVALISGGGSALVAAPRPGVSLDEKATVAAFLEAAGATIEEINAVRRVASDVKGGGLAGACRAGRLVTLVLSDIPGDPLAAIASGPCMPPLPAATGARIALEVLERYGARRAGVVPGLVRLVEVAASGPDDAAPPRTVATNPPWSAAWINRHGCRVEHLLLGGNDTAVAAGLAAARHMGYESGPGAGGVPRETAVDVGRRLACTALAVAELVRRDGRPRVVIEGGEAVVRLPARHGRGGRNQHTVLVAVAEVLARAGRWPAGVAVASLGTDGEDGPTDAAGAVASEETAARAGAAGIAAGAAAERYDAHRFLDATGALVRTGLTGTNVADLRIVVCRPARDRQGDAA